MYHSRENILLRSGKLIFDTERKIPKSIQNVKSLKHTLKILFAFRILGK